MIQLSRWKIITVALAAVLAVLFSVPNALSPETRAKLPGFMSKTLNLGLDLQGGSYLLLEVDTTALRKERLTNLIEDIRVALKDEQIAYSGLGQVGDQINLQVVDPSQMDAAVRTLTRIGGQTAQGARELTVQRGADNTIRVAFTREAIAAEGARAVDQSIEIVRRRVDALGTKEPSIQRQGATRIVVQAPGESDPEKLKRVIGQTAKLTFQMVDETVPALEAQAGHVPPGSELLPSEDGREQFVLVKKRILVSGDSLTMAKPSFDQYGRPAISFRFNGAGARKFGDATARNIGKRFAIVLDGKVLSAPVIQSAITGGSGEITGSFTQESATELANLLQGGALPAPLKVQEQRTVGAELGKDAVEAGKVSTLIGFVAIVAFMILAYGLLFGGISVLGLVLNLLLMTAAMTVWQATLTLPGVAGLILSLALAVDANVLIYERIRDEERTGHSPRAAIDVGFQRALVSILDANVTSLIAAGIMFAFGAGPVRGFAWTLSIGVFTSVFSAVLVSQVLLGWWLQAKRPKKLPI
jgi:protein-export membrane protein SecD